MPPAGKSNADATVRSAVDAANTLVSVSDLRVHFAVQGGLFGRASGIVKAVDGISFDILPGRTLGLVGESGCGKTTAGRAILRLVPATGGRVAFDGHELFSLPARKLRALRRGMQIIFQDPYGSLNPRMTVESIVGEPLTVHCLARGRLRRERVAEVLQKVGISPAYMNRYPHEFSGGQRQRISIARAIVLSPRFIVCDECVSALDVSVQSQILNLLGDLQREMGLAYLFIAHNLAVVRQISQEIAVMYLGRIVEIGATEDIFTNPRHPYTRLLLASIPRLEALSDPSARRARPPVGEAPSPLNAPTGCAFHPRCPFATTRCRQETPMLESYPSMAAGHRAACHYAEDELVWPNEAVPPA